jgi:hypothetical protein
MKKIHLTAFVAAAFAVMTSPLVHAQTSFTLDGTSGTNSYTNNYTPGGGFSQVNLSLGFFADYLVVGGGGSGGTAGDTSGTGGGGGGGLRAGTNLALSASNYSVTVGAGGVAPNTAGSSSVQGVNGSNSVFGSITATGGGGGGRFNTSGNTGGSGGGAGGRASASSLRTTGPSSPGSQRDPLSTSGPCCQPSAARMMPPSTSNTRPVTSADSTLPSHTTSGEMFSGAMASNPSSGLAIISAKTVSVIRVRAEGAIALTVTPYRPISAAATMVRAAIPALAAL